MHVRVDFLIFWNESLKEPMFQGSASAHPPRFAAVDCRPSTWG